MPASAEDTAPGETTTGTVDAGGVEYRYAMYTPSTYEDGRAVPLVVVVHGCQTTAAEMQETTRFDELAEEEGFVVLYPDVDAYGRALEGELHQCWRIFDPAALTRGSSDAEAIAEMTQTALADRTIDSERVYVVGASAGGLMAAAQAAAYPDLYAAVGLVATAGYANVSCFTSGQGIPVEESAQRAFDEMGPRARVVPVLVIGSTGDLAFPASCADSALEQGLRTNNLVISGSQDGPIPLTPARVDEKQEPGGYRYTVSTYDDPDGCVVAEKTIVDGMPHTWTGGATGRGDPNGPSGAEITWAFFSRFTKTSTAMPCAEAPTPAATSDAPTSVPPSDTGSADDSNDVPLVPIGIGAVAVVLLCGGAARTIARRRT